MNLLYIIQSEKKVKKKTKKADVIRFKKYSMWKDYVSQIGSDNYFNDNTDFFRYLVMLYRNQLLYINLLLSLYLPIMMAILTCYWNVSGISGIQRFICVLITMFFLMVFMIKVTYEAQYEKYFIRDYAEIIWADKKIQDYV